MNESESVPVLDTIPFGFVQHNQPAEDTIHVPGVKVEDNFYAELLENCKESLNCHETIPAFNDVSTVPQQVPFSAIRSSAEFPCPFCKQSFRQAQLRSNHLTDEHDVLVMFECSFCSTMLASTRTYHAHLFRCKKRLKSAFSRGDPTATMCQCPGFIHVMDCHLNAEHRRRYQCAECNMFPLRSLDALTSHECTKTNVYGLDIKKPEFGHEDSIEETIDAVVKGRMGGKSKSLPKQLVHAVLPPKSQQQPKEVCPFCRRAYYREHWLQKHLVLDADGKAIYCKYSDPNLKKSDRKRESSSSASNALDKTPPAAKRSKPKEKKIKLEEPTEAPDGVMMKDECPEELVKTSDEHGNCALVDIRGSLNDELCENGANEVSAAVENTSAPDPDDMLQACPICDEIFASFSLTHQHLSAAHAIELFWRCALCLVDFATSGSYEAHTRQCGRAQQGRLEFIEKENRLQILHARVESEGVEVQFAEELMDGCECPRADDGSSNGKAEDGHEENCPLGEVMRRRYTCIPCQQTFEKVDELGRHRMRRFDDPFESWEPIRCLADPPFAFACPFCDERITSLSSYTHHLDHAHSPSRSAVFTEESEPVITKVFSIYACTTCAHNAIAKMFQSSQGAIAHLMNEHRDVVNELKMDEEPNGEPEEEAVIMKSLAEMHPTSSKKKTKAPAKEVSNKKKQPSAKKTPKKANEGAGAEMQAGIGMADECARMSAFRRVNAASTTLPLVTPIPPTNHEPIPEQVANVEDKEDVEEDVDVEGAWEYFGWQ